MPRFPTASDLQDASPHPEVGDIAQVLRAHTFAHGLSESQVAGLAVLAANVTFAENEVILDAGQRSTFFYLLVEGSVAVELRTPRYAVCVQAVGPGQVFGWSALLDHRDTVFQVRSRERSTALRLDGAALTAAFQTDSQLGVEILRRTLQVVADRVKATELRFAEMCGIKP
jgi:CRP/FNR family cyclic AMP-dependent transcriptional regulator